MPFQLNRISTGWIISWFKTVCYKDILKDKSEHCLAKIVFDLLIIRFYEINIPFVGYFLHEVWGLLFDCQDFPTERSLPDN
jgi:hypothetical protein